MTAPRWAYGVTTVPMRLTTTLPDTLLSLKAAGFDRPRLFVDGATHADVGSFMERYGEDNVTVRFPRIRAYGNWILALAELYIRNPECARYAIFQDDFVTYPCLRTYLDACPYPDRGYWNLYTFPSNQKLCPKGGDGKDWIGWYKSNQFGRGAVALVFNQEAVQILLSHQHMVMRAADVNRGWHIIDGAVVDTMRQSSWTEYVHNPSLTQHTGHVSAIGHKPQKQAPSFQGEAWSALNLMPHARKAHGT